MPISLDEINQSTILRNNKKIKRKKAHKKKGKMFAWKT